MTKDKEAVVTGAATGPKLAVRSVGPKGGLIEAEASGVEPVLAHRVARSINVCTEGL